MHYIDIIANDISWWDEKCHSIASEYNLKTAGCRSEPCPHCVHDFSQLYNVSTYQTRIFETKDITRII